MGNIRSTSGIIASVIAVAVLSLVAPIAHAQYTTIPPVINQSQNYGYSGSNGYYGYSSAPSVYTNMAVNISDTSATLSGTVYPNGYDTVAWFQYGDTSSLGHSTPAQDVGAVYSVPSFTAVVTGLNPTTTYYYRIVSQNAFGTNYGTILTFNTLNYYSSYYSAPSNPSTSGTVTGSTNSQATDTNSTLNSVLGSMSRILADMKSIYSGNQNDQVSQNSKAPVVAVAAASTSSFTVKSTISPNGSNTIAWFEYGPTESLGHKTQSQNVGSGTAVVPVSATLTGLNPNTTYYYRIVGSNSYGSSYGPVLTFVTGAGSSNIAAGQTINDYTASILSSLGGSWTIIGLIILVLLGTGVVVFLRFVLK